MRTTRLAVATHRSIDVATSVVSRARTPIHPLSFSLASFSFPPPIYPSSLSVGVSVAYARVELLRSRAAPRRRVQQTRKGGSAGTRAATDQRWPCARFLFPRCLFTTHHLTGPLLLFDRPEVRKKKKDMQRYSSYSLITAIDKSWLNFSFT